MASNNEFFVVKDGGRPPSRNSRIPPPPPNHPRPPPAQSGGIPPPRVINAAPHPADMHQAQRPGPPPVMPMPMPPQHQHPLVFQHDPPVRISDIRKERLTQDEAREELSEYYIYRFEPSQRLSDYDDDEDQDRRHNWESVFVMEVRGVTKKEAARQVRDLNKRTWSLGDKKSTLSGAQQRQLEKVLEELQARDHPFFQTNLVQISHQLGPAQLKVKHEKHHKHGHHKHGSKHIKDYRQLLRDPKHHKKSSSSSKDKKKPKPQERISLTAYYKKSPRPEVDALAIYHQREAHFRRLQQPQPPPPPAMPPPPEVVHHHGPDGGHTKGGGGNNVGGGIGAGGAGGGWNKGQGGGKNGGPVATVVHPDSRKGGGGRRPSRSPPGSPLSTFSDSDRSFISDTFSGDDMSTITPNSDTSSLGERRGSFHRHRPRKDRQYRLEGPSFFGIRHHNDPRVQGRDVHRITDGFPPPMVPAPVPQLVQPVVQPVVHVDIEQIKTDAYEAGRADARADVERIADKIAIATVSAVQQPPVRPPPRRLQHRPSIRLVHPGDVSHEEATLERLERLDLRDEALEEARFILADGPGRRRYPRREEVWEEDNRPLRRKPLDEAMDHIRRTDAAADLPYMENPFAPMPDERRRSSAGGGQYYSDFRRRDDFDMRLS